MVFSIKALLYKGFFMKTILLSIIAIFSLTIIGCSNIPTDPAESETSYLIYNPYVEQTQGEEVGDRKPGTKDTTKRPQQTIFGDLLISLNLNPEQKPIVEKLLTEYKKCVETCAQALKAAEREILMNARINQEAIVTKMKSGELTKEQGRQQLRQLREETQIKLKTLPKDKVRDCIKTCENEFIAKLKTILTPDQNSILIRWVESRGKRGPGNPRDTTIKRG